MSGDSPLLFILGGMQGMKQLLCGEGRENKASKQGAIHSRNKGDLFTHRASFFSSGLPYVQVYSVKTSGTNHLRQCVWNVCVGIDIKGCIKAPHSLQLWITMTPEENTVNMWSVIEHIMFGHVCTDKTTYYITLSMFLIMAFLSNQKMRLGLGHFSSHFTHQN